MASMVTTEPSRLRPAASFSSNRGIAVVSLVLSSTASCPRTRRLLAAKVETRCSAARPLARSWAHGLAVDRDRVERIGPSGADPVHEAGGEQARIDPVHYDVEPAPRGNSPVERQEPPQEFEMGASPIRDGLEAVALGDRGANRTAGESRSACEPRLPDFVCPRPGKNDPAEAATATVQPVRKARPPSGRLRIRERHGFSLSAARKSR